MALMTWNERYATGVTSIDTQHRKLIDMLNALQEAMLAGKGNDAVGRILDGLVQYTMSHFAHEERMFATHGYADAAAHKAEHDKLATQVIDFRTQFKEGKTRLTIDILKFLRDWLNGHILGTDMKYVPFLKAKNAA